MKKNLIKIILTGVIIFNITFVKAESLTLSQKDFDPFLKETTTINSTINFSKLNNTIKQKCNTKISPYHIESIKKNIQSLSKEKTILSFNIFKQNILEWKITCDDAILLIKTLENLQEHFKNLPKEEIINEETKEKDDEIWDIKGKVTIMNKKNNLTNSFEKDLARYTEKIVQETIEELLQQRILTENDIQQLNNKIILTYKKDYGINYGEYNATKNQAETTINKITLTIYLNSAEYFLKDFYDDIRRVLIHELGHYFSYQDQTSLRTFNKICEKNTCKKKDYINTYASTSTEEDFAETFAYRYFKNHNTNKFYNSTKETNIIKEKLQIFDTIFE